MRLLFGWMFVVLGLALSFGVAGAPGDQNESADRPLQQGAISAGLTHACAVTAGGSVHCWGLDSQGQLGDGAATTTGSSVPVGAVPLGQFARAISAGSGFTCALLADGSVRCWGKDGFGELGDGATTTGGSTVPGGAVALGQGARAITAGADFACALLNDASVRCWGHDDFGQLGDGAITSSINYAPVGSVALGEGAIAITAGAYHACALLADTSVRCWGYDVQGQLGDGPPTTGPNAAPVAPVALGQPVRAISAGGFQSCALLADRTVRCWGDDSAGGLGDGPPATSTNAAPVAPVTLGQGARAISGGGNDSTCALLVNDSVRCWGSDTQGQLGDGGTTSPVNAAAGGVVALGQPARAVTAGGYNACALLGDGTVRCWGGDDSGQLGDGGATLATNASPVGVVGLPPFASPDSSDLSLTATASTPAATVGDQVTITLTLANAGVDATTGVIAAPLGAGLTPVTTTVSQGSYSSATGLWNAATIPAGASATLTLIAKVVSPGTLSSTAEVVDASAQDPDSTPANDIAGEDDRATATLTAAAPLTPAPPGALPATKGAPDLLTVSLKPARDPRAPFRFTPTASLVITKLPLAGNCGGTVTFTAKAGTKTVLTQRAPVRLKNGVCAATTKTTLRRRPGKATKLTYAAAFPGNATLTAIKSRSITARIG